MASLLAAARLTLRGEVLNTARLSPKWHYEWRIS